MIILAIDPGPKESAYMIFETIGERILSYNTVINEELRIMIKHSPVGRECSILSIESIEGFGIPAGMETFDTCFWSGRFCESFSGEFKRIGRKTIKSYFCNTTSAKDKDIRASLIYRFGEQGTKQSPGKLYGISGHVWSALAIAVYQSDALKRQPLVERGMPVSDQ